MSFRFLILPVLATQLAWSQQLAPSDAKVTPPPTVSGQPAAAPADELVDPFEGLGEMSDNAEKEWLKVVNEETPKLQQTCVAVRIHASVSKILAARAKYDVANKNYLEATGRYAADSLSSLSKPKADDAPKLDGLMEDLKRAQTQVDAKKKEKADAVAAGGAKESYLNSLDDLIKLTSQEADDIQASITTLQQTSVERDQQQKEWSNLKDLADQRVRNAVSISQKYATHYEETGEAQLAKCALIIDKGRVQRQQAEPGQDVKPAGKNQ